MRFAVVSPYCRQFMVCRCCSWFFGSFITRTLHAALQCYTNIAVSVFNNFGRGFAVFGAFCCGFVVLLSSPQCPPPGTDHHRSTNMNYKARWELVVSNFHGFDHRYSTNMNYKAIVID